MQIIDVINNTNECLETARKAVEDELIRLRDSRISKLLRNNGLVIKESNGNPSEIIRLSIEDCIRIGLKAILDKE
jgi:hypothetical protein